MKYLKSALAAAAIFSIMPAAQATNGSASINVSNITIAAFDVFPGDAFSPAFELPADRSQTVLSYGASGFTPTEVYQSGALASAALNGPYSTAAVTPSSMDVAISVTGDAYNEFASAATGPVTWQTYNLRLAPKTGVMVTVDLQMAASAFCDPATSPSPYSCGAQATFGMELSGKYLGHNGPSNTSSFHQSVDAEDGAYDPPSFSGKPFVYYVNLSDSYEAIHFLMNGVVQVSAVSIGPVNPPIPEPATYALLFAGLAVVGLRKVRH